MQKNLLVVACCFLALSLQAKQNPPQSPTDVKPAQAVLPAGTPEVRNVLAQADKAADKFKSAKAKFKWEQYQADKKAGVQDGEIVFRRTKSGTEATLHMSSPQNRQAALADGTVKAAEAKIKPVVLADDSVQHDEIESFLSLGFGSRSDDILKSYAVTMEGWEKLDGVNTARLNLVPKNVLKDSITNIVLWLDPVRDVSLQQKFVKAGGNYKLVHYTGIEVNGSDELKDLFAQSDKAADTFKSAKAKFQWDQYEKVVDETEVQKGEIFFRRSKSGMDAAVRVTSPAVKQVVFVNGTLKLFQPNIKELTIYDASAKRAEVDSLMNIGFGSRSADIEKSYEVKMEGWETVDGVKTARLNLVPKNDRLKASVTNIILWLDPQRDVSLQQKFLEPGGNFRLTHYKDIEINGKVSNDVFDLKTPSDTTIVKP